MDYILEQFDLDPLKEIYESFEIIDDSILEEAYIEATTNVSKGNIIEKIINFIKIAIDWVVKQFGNLFNFIKGIFTGKKDPASKIINDIGIKPQKKFVKKNIKEIKISDLKTGNIRKVNIADRIYKDISISFKKDKNVKMIIVNNHNFLDAELKRDENDKKLKTGTVLYNTLYAMFKTDIHERYFILLKNFMNDKNQDKFNSEFKNISSEGLNYVFNDSLPNGIEIDMDDINKFQRKVLSFSDIISKITANDFDISDFSKETITNFTGIQSMVINMEKTMKTITDSLKHIYELDDRYTNSIKDIEKLSQFVEKMVSNGYSFDNILINVMKVYDLPNDVQTGTGRLVIMENNDNVMKIAFNGFGLQGNQNEIKVFNLNKSASGENKLPLSPISEFTKNKYILRMERATKDVPSQDELNRFVALCAKSKLLPDRYISDIHPGNVRFDRNNKPVMIDYGFIRLGQDNDPSRESFKHVGSDN